MKPEKVLYTFLSSLQRMVRRKQVMVATLLLAFMIGAFILNRQGYIAPERIFMFLNSHQILAPALFIFLYVLMSLSLVPTLPLNLGAGFLWGPFWGSLFSIVGATAGAACAFLASRYLAGNYCSRKFHNPAWLWLRDEIEAKGWKVVAFIRLNPIFSSGPLNYLFGITPIPFSTYLWSTALFFTPPSILVASIGHFIGWGALTGGAQNLIQNIVILASASTLMLVFTLTFKKWLKKKS